MKKLTQIGALFCLLAFAGCATNRAVYNTLASVKATTDTAVSGYFDMVAKQQASIKGVPAVARAYDTFEVAFGFAIQMAQFNTNTVAPPSVVITSSEVLTAIIAAKGVK